MNVSRLEQAAMLDLDHQIKNSTRRIEELSSFTLLFPWPPNGAMLIAQAN